MRLHVISDLHLETGDLEIPAKQADVVVLAGDIHLGRQGLDWARANFSKTPVVYILGNHEFYGQHCSHLLGKLQEEARGTNIHILENNAVTIEGWRFVGCTLWTDFSTAPDPLLAMQTAERRIRDYSAIAFGSPKRALRARDTVAFHHESLSWIKNQLAETDCSRTIVATHHAPSLQSEAPCYAGGPLTAAADRDRPITLVYKIGEGTNPVVSVNYRYRSGSTLPSYIEIASRDPKPTTKMISIKAVDYGVDARVPDGYEPSQFFADMKDFNNVQLWKNGERFSVAPDGRQVKIDR